MEMHCSWWHISFSSNRIQTSSQSFRWRYHRGEKRSSKVEQSRRCSDVFFWEKRIRLVRYKNLNSRNYRQRGDINAQRILKEIALHSRNVDLIFKSAWKENCDIHFLVSPSDADPSSIPANECRIAVPSLNMCFTTNKLQPLTIEGNIFDLAKPRRPLTIQDYLQILIEHDQFIDSELAQMMSSIQTLTARFRRSSEMEKPPDDSKSSYSIFLFSKKNLIPFRQTFSRIPHLPKGCPRKNKIPIRSFEEYWVIPWNIIMRSRRVNRI